MSKKEIYEQKAEALVTPIVEKYGFELVDVEYVKKGVTFTFGLTLTNGRHHGGRL